MTGDRHRSDADRFDRMMNDHLREPLPTPDFTPQVMKRLGFAPASPAAMRQRRVRRLMQRGVMTAGCGTLIVAALMVHQVSEDARHPALPTIPAAINHDLQQINRTIRTLQELAPSPRPAASPESVEQDVDRSAIGPVRWV